METLNLFKVEYDWYEGEHEERLLGKNVDQKQFEKDLIKAKEFAESLIGKEIKNGNYLGNGYSVECLPEYYSQIIWYLTERLGYIECYIDETMTYDVDSDSSNKRIIIRRSKNCTKRSELR